MQQSSFAFGQPQPQSQPFGATSGSSGFGFGGFGSQGQTTNQPSFGASFAASAASTATPAFGTQPSFGGFGSSTFGSPQTGTAFGTQQQQQPQQQQQLQQQQLQQQQLQQQSTPFGGGTTTTFGSPAQPVATGFGAAQPQPTLGFGSSTPGTGFGTVQTPSLFGSSQPQTTTTFSTGQSTFGSQPSTGFGSLGSTTFGTAQPSLFGSTQPTSGFGTSQPSTFGTTQQPGSWFGSSQPQTSTFTGFGGGSSLFGQQKPAFSFAPSFGQPQPSLFNQPVQQQQQQQQVDEQVAFHQSIFACCKFGDDRDAILANLNFIQACWGGGKGFYNQSHPPVAYNDKNVFYRFKAVGYSFLYNDSNEDGQVAIHIRKSHSKVRDEETQFINNLQAMIAKPNIFFKITGSKAVNEEMAVIILTADDKTSLRRILATDLAAALQQPQLKPHLDSLGIVNVCAKVKPSPEQLKAYLENPPAGLDARVWKKAQEDNPDPINMIPIPLLGPGALKSRLEAQTKESQQHQERLQLISDEVTTLTNRHANISAELQQIRRRGTVLSHRILSALLRLQMLHKQDNPLQVEEVNLKRQMEELEKQLNSPNQFRGRLNELISHMRLHKSTLESRISTKYVLDTGSLEQVKQFLNLQQESIKHLVDTVKHDTEYVHRMAETVSEFHAKGGPS